MLDKSTQKTIVANSLAQLMVDTALLGNTSRNNKYVRNYFTQMISILFGKGFVSRNKHTVYINNESKNKLVLSCVIDNPDEDYRSKWDDQFMQIVEMLSSTKFDVSYPIINIVYGDDFCEIRCTLDLNSIPTT